jgi:hypothetical protein
MGFSDERVRRRIFPPEKGMGKRVVVWGIKVESVR